MTSEGEHIWRGGTIPTVSFKRFVCFLKTLWFSCFHIWISSSDISIISKNLYRVTLTRISQTEEHGKIEKHTDRWTVRQTGRHAGRGTFYTWNKWKQDSLQSVQTEIQFPVISRRKTQLNETWQQLHTHIKSISNTKKNAVKISINAAKQKTETPSWSLQPDRKQLSKKIKNATFSHIN